MAPQVLKTDSAKLRLFEEVDTDAQSSDSIEQSHEGTEDEQMEVDEEANEAPFRSASQTAKQSEVERVQRRVGGRVDSVDALQEMVSQLEVTCSCTDNSKLLQEALANIDEVRKLARNYSEDLLEDMLALDKLSGLALDDRTSRKAVIAQIEAMLDILDGAKIKLVLLHQKMEDRLKTLMTVPAPTSVEDEQRSTKEKCAAPRSQSIPSSRLHNDGQPLQQHARSQPELRPSAEVPKKGFWKQVPLQVPFQIQDAGDKYLAATSARGMNIKDLSLEVSNSGRHLLVKGTRLPTSQEALQLQARVQDALGLQHLAYRNNSSPEELIRHLYVKAGQGSFGAFDETLRIPGDADIRGIEASCHEGMLCIVIPKVPRQIRPGMLGGRPRMPLSARQYGRHPFHNGLLADFW